MAALSVWAGADLYRGRSPAGGEGVILQCLPEKEPPRVIITKEERGPGEVPEACPDFIRHALGCKININLAKPEDLRLLYGIGAKTAERIVSEREAKKGFKSLDDLETITGLSPRARESLHKWTEVK